MTYQNTLDFLFTQLPAYQRDGKAAYKANLDNTHALDKYFNHPHRSYLTIHVAGTNGKGSVSHMLASVLQEAGYKTGLYTSPHLKDFRERIKVNGDMISEDDVVDFVSQHSAMIKELKPSFFEMTVAMAFKYFEQQDIDIAVIETGMGGRLDSTNIVTPLVSVITNIGLDHTAFLGDNLKAIAGEKAGIIKPNVPIVIGEWQADTATIFLNKALHNGSEITFANKVRELVPINQGPEFSVHFESEMEYLNLECDLKGEYQANNILTALTTLNVLQSHLNVTAKHVKSGLSKVVSNTTLKGRWQIIPGQPRIICDTGHNTEGIKYIVDQLKKQSFQQLHMVIGMVNDKSIDKVLSLLPKSAKYYFTKANIPRALSEVALMRQAKGHGLQGSCYANVEFALKKAKDAANADDLIFVGGSTFVVAEVPDL